MVDLIIKNGRKVNEQVIDVAIHQGKIVAVGEKVDIKAKEVMDLKSAYYLSAGWIDCHVHCFEEMDLYYDYPDEIGIKKGVTSIIDAGSTGAQNIGDFYKLAMKAKTNVYALVNISKTGIVAQNELANLDNIKKQLVTEVLRRYPDFIVGLKARMSRTVIGDNGIKPLLLAKEIQRENHDLPLMVHIGSAPPKLSEILEILDERDTVTHCFNGKENGLLDQVGNEIKSCAVEAKKRGVAFDVGHGTDSFNFKVAERAKKMGFESTTISTDVYHRNRESGPVYDLATTMEKMLVIGYLLTDVINQVTIASAKQFNLENKGALKVGYDADLTIFEVKVGEKVLMDSNGQTRQAKQLIKPVKTIVGGIQYEC